MDKSIKNYLGMSIIAAMMIAAVSTLIFANIYSKSIQPSSYRSFSVSAESKVAAVPDVAKFSFSVITEGGKDVASLQKENTSKVNRAIGVVKASGVADKDVQTSVYNIEPRYQYFSCSNNSKNIGAKPCPPPEIIGYSVTQTVSVKVRDFEKISGILSGVVQSGVNSVSQLSFTVDDRAEIENQARKEAMSKAIAKAESIASAGGFRLGRLLSVNEGGGYYPRYAFKEAASYDFGMGGDIEPPSIEPGSEEITISVNLTYEIK